MPTDLRATDRESHTFMKALRLELKLQFYFPRLKEFVLHSLRNSVIHIHRGNGNCLAVSSLFSLTVPSSKAAFRSTKSNGPFVWTVLSSLSYLLLRFSVVGIVRKEAPVSSSQMIGSKNGPLPSLPCLPLFIIQSRTLSSTSFPDHLLQNSHSFPLVFAGTLALCGRGARGHRETVPSKRDRL
jgi:hypothetical protein